MFDFGDANEAQRRAIAASDGPVLITAGPGTGKTFTLVQRAIYLIQERGVRPENILIATFTEKAAKELITRITNELTRRNITVNLQEMYIGTFHSICIHILKDHLEHTRLRKNFRMLDDFDQKYLVYRNLRQFRAIPDLPMIFSPKDRDPWQQAQVLCGYLNNVSEEMVDPAALIADRGDPAIAALGRAMQMYEELLRKDNLLDFSSIQVETYRLLRNCPDVLEQLREQITHIMVDEYQDTNYIQEQLVFLLAGKRQNICVVGDDDQGLYRFRGATIRNILEFPQKFPAGRCQVIPLVMNYRSNSDIVDFFNQWMSATSCSQFSFQWGRFRYDKKVVPHKKSTLRSPGVVKLAGADGEAWYQAVLNFIRKLRSTGAITDYNQVAFLFQSVKSPEAVGLAAYLERGGVHVYSPRSDQFFQRKEVKLTLGCLMLLFPDYVQGLESTEETPENKFLRAENRRYYTDCLAFARALLARPEYADLQKWIWDRAAAHARLTGTTDYAFCGLLYGLFRFPPFSKILDTELDTGVMDLRPARNLAQLTQFIGRYEYLNNITVLSAKPYRGRRSMDWNVDYLFGLYLRMLLNDGISEYEDDSEYAPSGCVSFLTIHQSKGMEFPIVLVDSLARSPWRRENSLMDRIGARYFQRPPFEPAEDIKYFDFWRLYYTAFSRAQDLLVLTCGVSWKAPSPAFRPVYDNLPAADSPGVDLSEFRFQPVKDVNLKPIFSFTSDVTVYETCPRQYKFYKELGFPTVRVGSTLFGTLVHETIEDIHRAAMRHEEALITPENIAGWFNVNYISLVQSQQTYLAAAQQKAALNQVLRYAARQGGDWSAIQQAEVDVSLVEPDYIIEGKVDLIRGKGDTVEIVDFKSQRKPDPQRDREQLERYRRQLHVYAHLVEERTGKKVSRMHLYYTAEDHGTPTITFPYEQTAVDDTIAGFDATVHKIMEKDFHRCAADPNTCANCDFRHYCKREGRRSVN